MYKFHFFLIAALFFESFRIAQADETWLNLQAFSGGLIVNLACVTNSQGYTTCKITDCASGESIPMNNIQVLAGGRMFTAEINRTTYYFQTINPLHRYRCHSEILLFWNRVSRNLK